MILKERYKNICNEYLQRFCTKHGYHYEPDDAWIAGDAGGCAKIGDYVFGFDEIRYDIDNDVPKGKILDWYYGMENPYPRIAEDDKLSVILQGSTTPIWQGENRRNPDIEEAGGAGRENT